MEPKGSLLCSGEPVIGPYPEPLESTPHTHPTSLTHSLHIDLPSELLFSTFPIKVLYSLELNTRAVLLHQPSR